MLSRPTFVCVLAALVLHAAAEIVCDLFERGVAVLGSAAAAMPYGDTAPGQHRCVSPFAAFLRRCSAWCVAPYSVLLPQGNTALFMGPPSKVKNENVDDFATYLAKRKAAEEGRVWQPPGGAAAPAAKAAPSYSPAPSYSAPKAPQGYAPQNAGDVPYDAAWGGTPKAHTKDPTPVSAENNSLGKKGAIASGESFEEYMRKRAAGGK